MAETMASTPAACTEVTHATAAPLSPLARRFLGASRRMRVTAQCLAVLDGAAPWSPALHHHLRMFEVSNERIDQDLEVILRATPLFPMDAHLRDRAWKLQMARSLEDGEDSRFYLERLLAWPDLLFLSEDLPGAGRLNASIRHCLAALTELSDRNAPARQRARHLPGASDPGLGDPAVMAC
ncbi:hypothetical protein [Paracoccus luteus]|uniref:hypothetical protein n=1 Tax=Paracoccus luteus TaxID=2508543 RepID=UPI00106F390F|nr:hypothetical protein [Paracoccus luteus]